jgi:hypothetical protein
MENPETIKYLSTNFKKEINIMQELAKFLFECIGNSKLISVNS